MTFGERVAELRDEKGYTQADLAAELGASPSTVARWESQGKTPKQRNTLDALAELFGVRAEWLKTGRGQKYPHATVEEAIDAGYYTGVNVPEKQAAVSKMFAVGEQEVAYSLVRLRVSDGGGIHGGDGSPDHEYEVFTKKFLERIHTPNPEGLELGRVIGDSMTDFSPGAYYWYWPVTELVGSGDYVLELDGRLEVKRIIQLSGGALMISSTNYPEGNETLTPVSAGKYKSNLTSLEVGLMIVGKVAGVVKLK